MNATRDNTRTQKRVKSDLRRKRLCSLIMCEMMRKPNDSKELISCFSSCEKYGILPQTFLYWVSKLNLLDAYRNAREIMYDYEAERLELVAQEEVRITPDGYLDRTDLEQKRIRIDVTKWRMSHLASKYRTKVQHEHEASQSLADIISKNSKAQ